MLHQFDTNAIVHQQQQQHQQPHSSDRTQQQPLRPAFAQEHYGGLTTTTILHHSHHSSTNDSTGPVLLEHQTMLHPTILASQHVQEEYEQVHPHLTRHHLHQHWASSSDQMRLSQHMKQEQQQQQQPHHSPQHQIHQPFPQMMQPHPHPAMVEQLLMQKHDIGQAEQTLEQMCGGSGIVMTAVDSSPSSGYHRKRSLSVPLLFSMNQEPGENGVAGSASAATGAGAGARAAGEDGTSPNEDGDGDQDMEADDEQEDHSHDNTLDSTDSNAATAPLPTMSLSSSSSTALVLDYSALTLPRESLLATVPRSHRHRIFAAGHHHLHHHHQQQQQQQQQQHQHPHHPLYYNAHDYHHTNNNSHHNHYTLRHHLHYNPFTYRKFPPYQYWAASAQRDYHLATIGVGVVGRASGQHSRLPIRRSAAAILGLPSDSDSAAGSTFAGTGDLVLRSSSSAANGGGISKSNMFRSRLPVHLRHITSRANRRAAIYVNPYQPGGDVVDRRIRDTGRVEGSESGLGSGSATDEILMSSLSIEDDTTDSRSRALMPAASFSPSDAAASDTSSRRKLTDWKRVTAFKLDLEDSETHQRSGAVVRLGSHDLVTSKASSSLSTLSTSASAVSHGSGDASIVRSSGNGKQWMSQRGGLANLLQFSHRGSGSSKASAATNTVDRLVEEMNKWSV